jgi:hypothetical protein
VWVKEPSDTDYKFIGVDLAKTVFQVCALNQADKVVFNKTVRRGKLAKFINKLPSQGARFRYGWS